jgi:hypothetical protein
MILAIIILAIMIGDHDFGDQSIERQCKIGFGASPTPGLGGIGRDVNSSFPEELRSHRK